MEEDRLIKSLGGIYTSIYDIDLTTGRYHELSSFDLVQERIGKEGDIKSGFEYFVSHMVVSSFIPGMREFLDLDTVQERLEGKKKIYFEYLSPAFLSKTDTKEEQWTRCSFIDGGRDDKGKLLHVFFVVETIHKDKIKELEALENEKKANRNLEKLLKEEQRHSAIIEAMGSAFDSLYFVDIENKNMRRVISKTGYHDSYGEEEDLELGINNLVYSMAKKEEVTTLLEFVQPSCLHKRLKKNKLISHDFQNKDNRWSRLSIIPINNKEGKASTFLFALRDVDNEIKNIKIKNNVIQALSSSYENVYAVSEETGIAICFRMGKDIEKLYYDSFLKGNYEDNIKTYYMNEVIEEDRHLFYAIETPSKVLSKLKERSEYSFNYRINRNNRIHFFQCHIVLPSHNVREFVIGFKNVDEETRLNLLHQKEMDDALAAIEKTNKALREETAISSVLTKEYHSLFRIDASTGAMTLYRTDGDGFPPTLLSSLLKLSDYETIVDRYIDNFVHSDDRERIRENSRLKNLLEKTQETGLYKMGFRRILSESIQYYEMNVARSVDSKTLILGLRDVDQETRRQIRVSKEMEAQREIIEGLGSEYYSILLVDVVTDSVSTYRAYGEDGEAIDRHFDKNLRHWTNGVESYVMELVIDDDKVNFLEKLSLSYITENRGHDYSFTYGKKLDGDIFYLQARVAYVDTADGGWVAVVGTRNVDDIIKKEKKQEAALREAYYAAEAASKAKTDFLSSMSHDIRTPMNGIIGMTAIAASHLDDKERVKDSLEKITKASRHLLSLINEVLDMNKIESGKVQLAEDEFNLSDLVENLINMTSSQITEHNHTLNVNVSGVQHENVIGDSLRIQKIFTNLMGNAVKFTPNGGRIRLTITERPSRQEKVGCYEFIFEDNGIGMSNEFMAHIFEPFTRAEDGSERRTQGTGLGMTISRNIARMMGGDIKVESTLGVGSTFTVTIYLKLQENNKNLENRFIDLDVLVADDDELSLESSIDILSSMGMKVEGVDNGKDAVEKIVSHHSEGLDFFAAILDWKMPEMDGIEATREIRRRVGNDVPIIIISAYDWSEIEEEARRAGANAFIGKPLFKSRLEKTFSSILGKEEEKPVDKYISLSDLEALKLQGKRALVVEDNDLNMEIACEILKTTGMSIETANDGIEAVDMVSSSPDGYYDIVFMDIQMPKMNGYDATRAIRAQNRPYLKHVPIIAMTANAFAEDVQAARTVGMDWHIPKPLELHTLKSVLERYISR